MRTIKQSFLLFTFLFTAVFATAADLRVVSATPQGDNAPTGRNPISITFNQPVAALGEQNAFSGEDCPLSIVPAVSGTCRFVGTQTLQFEPAEDWQQATQYTVTLPGSFTSQVKEQTLGDNYVWSFTTPRPEIDRILPSDEEQWVDIRPLIYVTVSQPVNLTTAQEAFKLSYRRTDQPKPTLWQRFIAFLFRRPLPQAAGTVQVPVQVRPLTDEEYKEHYSYFSRDRIFVAEVQEPLVPHARVEVTIDTNLRGTEGNLGPEKPFKSVFYTYPKLEIVGGNFEGCLPLEAEIAFSSPVRLEDLLKHITVSPQAVLSKVTEQEKQSLGYQRRVPKNKSERLEYSSPVTLPVGTGYFSMALSFLRLNPEEPVSIIIDKDLTDIYGQKLGTTQHLMLRNNGYCPSVVFGEGKGVLESYLPARHPIDLMNEPELQVRAGRFSRADFIPFLEQEERYCQAKQIAKSNLQYDGKYTFDTTPNKTSKTYLDLSKFNPSARQSIIYSQVRVPRQYRVDGYCWESATDNITDLGVTLKTSRDNTLIWVTSLKEGTPKAGAAVELRDASNRILWTGQTDADGVAMAPGRKDLNLARKYSWEEPAIYAFVTSENGDAVLSSEWNDGLEPWRFNVRFNYHPEESGFMTALFTDRGIYRPGEKVHIKGLTRKQQNGAWGYAGLLKGKVYIYNSRDEQVLDKVVTYDNHSGFDLDFDLPENATTGRWTISFETSSNVAQADYSFRVEAVKQADFAVHLRSLKEAYVSGEKADFTASADYLFGAPVSKGKAKWTIRQSRDWFRPEKYEDYQFMPYFLMRGEEEETDGLLTQSSGELDEKGQINFSATLPKVTRRQSIYAEVGVEAPTGQQLFARTEVTLNPASFYLGAYMEHWVAELGDPVTAKIIAVDVNEQLVGPVKVKADIIKEEYFSVRKNGLAGRLEWVSERRNKDMGSQTFTVSKEGTDFSFLPKEPGSYQITLSAKDKQGNEVRGGFEVTVYGKGEAYWKQNDDDILILKQDKEVYNPGDTARILVESPYEKATALVTVERAGILEHWVTTVSGGADHIEVPVKADYTPNVFVSVTLIRGRAAEPSYDKEGLDLAKPQGKTGYTQLVVSQAEKEIRTVVSADKKQYLPGEEVTVALSTALQDKPVASDVTIMVVDEGVLALTGYQIPNLMKVFYAPQALSVSTADNRVFLIGQRNFGEKGENRGGGGGAFNQLGGTDLRSHFEFTPYFNARVRTDAQGKGEVKFKLPDNLTTFRIMAVSATAQEFGAGETSVKVSKPIMITPKMPRFIRQGDKLQCGAVVHNYEDAKGQITVSAKATGALQLTQRNQSLQISKGASAQVSWPCQTTETGAAEVTFAAVGAEAKDGVVLPISVVNIEKQQTLALYSATDEVEEQLLERPESVNEQADNEVILSLASTALLNLRGGMLYLLTYPYDCLEQKMSKILPVIEGAKLVEDFKLGDTSAYQKTTQEILTKMPTYQATSGGFAYWPGAQADPYVTAYALEVAKRAERAGYKVPTAALDKAVKWLKNIFTSEQLQAYPYSAAENSTSRAYAVYVLSLYGQKLDGQFNALYGQRNSLSVPARAYLLLASQSLQKSADIQQTLAQTILNRAQYGAQTIHFSTSDAPQPWLHMGDVKVTSLALQALLETNAPLAQPYQVVHWLINQLNAGGYWKNTSDNAAVFAALHAYYTRQESAVPDFTANVSFDGTDTLSVRFAGRSLQTQNKQIPFEQIYAKGDQARVKLSKFGAGTLYYTLAQRYTPQKYTDPVNAGFEVLREITDLQNNPVKEFKAGERYKVILKTRTATDYSFVVLEDFIPAGFEIVNTALVTESQADAATITTNTWGNFERDEKYDDRIVAFADFLSAGEHTHTYLVQATVPGEFAYPSAWASEMYDPAVFGRNATSAVVVRP